MARIIVGIEKGKFTVSANPREDENPPSGPLTADGLSELLKASGYDPMNENHILLCSSSMDFPEDDGAPEGFDARGTLREAIVLMFPEDKRDAVRAAMEG